jgi:hypothetical protein
MSIKHIYTTLSFSSPLTSSRWDLGCNEGATQNCFDGNHTFGNSRSKEVKPETGGRVGRQP